MKVPLGILELILQKAAECLSYEDIVRFRLVNSGFSSKLHLVSTLNLSGPLRESAMASECTSTESKVSLHIMGHIPSQAKIHWYLIEEHDTRLCHFSYLIQNILEVLRAARMSI
ncbi:uncharacterized protein N7479_004943 [Penicillium vulpinum]|uniref:Uncharacterized protein n=1 Tax=Penicillium vulpinum TaxID=29845 RepID=A0A1V6RGW3_9EURO|nr:uncharacterized protein N7479_004943 [Penicillium vulpinum]KAJ5965067.1 hypothetical protein N7479_004943 [Penicillium vulpinum]OQE00724.1 hypothetical protein PENVUL_c047G10354 [Penicillium vulpinum]